MRRPSLCWSAVELKKCGKKMKMETARWRDGQIAGGKMRSLCAASCQHNCFCVLS